MLFIAKGFLVAKFHPCLLNDVRKAVSEKN